MGPQAAAAQAKNRPCRVTTESSRLPCMLEEGRGAVGSPRVRPQCRRYLARRGTRRTTITEPRGRRSPFASACITATNLLGTPEKEACRMKRIAVASRTARPGHDGGRLSQRSAMRRRAATRKRLNTGSLFCGDQTIENESCSPAPIAGAPGSLLLQPAHQPKLNDIDPQVWLADVLARIVGHPAHLLDELLPWELATDHHRLR